MDRDDGMGILKDGGWLSATPAEFQQAILTRSTWGRLEAGAQIQAGGEEHGELIGLARGIVEMRTILGRADTPIMHFARPVFWFGYVPILTGRPRGVAASAKSPVWLARIPQAAVRALLAKRPEWWRHLMQLSIIYGEVSQTIAADLLIRDSERRCAAVLLRLGGLRFAGRGFDHAKRFRRRGQSVAQFGRHDAATAQGARARRTRLPRHNRPRARGAPRLRRWGIAR